jgi:hypothetical protein
LPRQRALLAGRKPDRRQPLRRPEFGLAQARFFKLASSISLRGAIVGDPLDEGDGDRAQKKNVDETAPAENQAEKPDGEERERDYPEHLAFTCPRF